MSRCLELHLEHPKVQTLELLNHKGSLNTLIAERNELIKIVQVTEQLMSAHLKALQELGVKIDTGSAEKKK